MAYLNGKEILFSPHIHTDPASEYKLQQAREEGKAAGWDEFWDMFQYGGNRASYNGAFRDWSAEYIRPKYKVVPTHQYSGSYTFADNKNLKKVEAEHFDFSQKEKGTGTNQNNGYYSTFQNCSELVEIEDIGLVPQINYHQSFYNCKTLKTIAQMGVGLDTKFSNTFTNCKELVNLIIDGEIGQNGLDLRHSTKLSRASIESVINALTDDAEHLYTVSNPTITLSKTAVENAFSKIDLLADATFSDTTVVGGLEIRSNGDGSFTLNGMYDGGPTGHDFCQFTAATVMLPQVEGVYSFALDGKDSQYISDAYSSGGYDSIYYDNSTCIPTEEPTTIEIHIKPNVEINNLTVRPQLVRDEWKSLIYHISHIWEIKEE